MDTYKSRWSGVTAMEDRYDNLIAFPEGGMDYDEEVLSAEALYYSFEQAAVGMQHVLQLIGYTIPPQVTDILADIDRSSYVRIQQTHRITWGQIGALLDTWQSDMMALSMPVTEITP
ncbi:MAG: hypothetical protein UY35_C0008G0018 [Candidatus Saccharibacteria bacterium GW2011_GWC2_48_9]|nr:MAG: hypothetical protein UY35_C0008G0018 [Candidatus Saccharibacteria bacterium GW2011_GWC2_48_9]HCH34473.1 hypothetical protein [Candidatus Saccharibacteria bacterium]